MSVDLTGKSAEKRRGLGALGVTLVTAFRTGFAPWTMIPWVVLTAVLGAGLLLTRRRNAAYGQPQR